MKKVFLYTILLIFGLIGSQFLPLLGPSLYPKSTFFIHITSMVFLSFIMIQVGMDFFFKKNALPNYGKDYLISITTAGFPWTLCALYFIYILPQPEEHTNIQIWKESLFASRFAASTSAGVLFSMLAAVGLRKSWVFRRARILAIFDDLNTILLMIPLKILLVGFHWEISLVLIIVCTQIWAAWHYLNKVEQPTSWPWILIYSVAITGICESIYSPSLIPIS